MLMTRHKNRRCVTIDDDALYSVTQAAEILGLSDVRVRQFCQQSRFGLKVGGHYVIHGKELREFSQTERPRGKPGHKN